MKGIGSILLLALSALNSALACTCGSPTPDEAWQRTPHIFVARIGHVEPLDSKYRNEAQATFTVLETLKGQPVRISRLIGSDPEKVQGGTCAYELNEGAVFLVASDSHGYLHGCSSSSPILPEESAGAGLYGRMLVQYFRARVANERSSCVYDQASQIEELMRLGGLEHFRLSGWKAVSADPENLEIVFKRNDGAVLEVQRGGCDHLGYAVTFRDPNSRVPETEALDIAVEQTKYFWDEKERRELKEYVESGQFEVEEGTDSRLYTLFHPDLYMTVKYNREDASVTAGYLRTY